ncbi:uncharacterized protein A1O9_05592, partial [Exophiala aquamarina CBS 119918]
SYILPLVGSSLTVFYAFAETAVFSSFLRAADHDPATTSQVVRHWWSAFLVPGTSLVFATTLPTIISGSYALKYLSRGSSEWKLVLGGVISALAHFAFVPPIAATISAITDEEVEKRGETIAMVRKWLKLHFWRFALTDLPSLVCFTILSLGS